MVHLRKIFKGYLTPYILVVIAFVTTATTASSSPFGRQFEQHALLTNLSGGASRLLAKNEQESEVVAPPLSQSPVVDQQREGPLLRDIDLLSQILGELVSNEDLESYKLYEEFRHYGLSRAGDPNNEDALKKMIQRAAELTADQAVVVTRSFSIMLNLVNSAEVHHRQRVTRQHDHEKNDATIGPLPISEDSIRGTIDHLLKNGRVSPREIVDQLQRQRVEIVLTAHPTQVQRKSLLRKYRKISEMLAFAERPDLSAYEKQSANETLKRIISSIWGADEIRRNKPTPQQEAAGGNAIIESVLWDAVPSYLRKLQTQCQLQLGMKLPVDCTPIKFASWIGGDRDGNPNVTPEVTREVILQQRLRAARLLTNDMYQLLSELAISARFSPEMEQLADSITDSPHRFEKYRRVIGHLIKRLAKTTQQSEMELAKLTDLEDTTQSYTREVDRRLIAGWQDSEPILDESDLMEPLKIMHSSLVETGFELVADGLLSDIIRRIAVFGLCLVPLDIREESTRHTEALDAITRFLGIGSYKDWDEQARIRWLSLELSNQRPLFSVRDIESGVFDAGVVKTIRTFTTAASMKPSELGAYVISQAQTASDVLAVMLLQKQCGMTDANRNMMRVVPLFETLDDLKNAPSVLQTLFSIPLYVGKIKGKQEIMVGYSDSAKDAGRLAACWAQYNAQVLMVEVSKRFGIDLTFFHGKGGTVGRGGNPSVYRAIMSHPPGTINGRFRVTEQGEMITQNFGTFFIAERTLDIYTAAVCREAFVKHVEPTKEWYEQMDRISEISCADYRHLVREEPRFVPYFRQATPEVELGVLNIGSRPAKRNPKGGVESLRAIPWAFAWAQTRSQLSAWLGVGAGLLTDKDETKATLQKMYEGWPWFRETIDLVSMIVSKTDFSISKNYDDQLVDKAGLIFGDEIRAKLVETRQAILDVTKSQDVAGAHVALQRASSQIRHPYLDPVNVIQAEILKRFRKLEGKESLSSEEVELKEKLKDALVLSINAIAQGMKNSG